MAVARVRGTSANALIVEPLAGEIDQVRSDKDFTDRARKLLERDKELLDRLDRRPVTRKRWTSRVGAPPSPE